MVEEAVQLCLAKPLNSQGNIVTQLGEGLQAAVRDELRGVETAAEQAPAIAAELGGQQRGEGILPVDGSQDEKPTNSGCIRDSVNSILVKSARP